MRAWSLRAPCAPAFNLGVSRLVAPPRLIELLEEGFARLGFQVG